MSSLRPPSHDDAFRLFFFFPIPPRPFFIYVPEWTMRVFFYQYRLHSRLVPHVTNLLGFFCLSFCPLTSLRSFFEGTPFPPIFFALLKETVSTHSGKCFLRCLMKDFFLYQSWYLFTRRLFFHRQTPTQVFPFSRGVFPSMIFSAF